MTTTEKYENESSDTISVKFRFHKGYLTAFYVHADRSESVIAAVLENLVDTDERHQAFIRYVGSMVSSMIVEIAGCEEDDIEIGLRETASEATQ